MVVCILKHSKKYLFLLLSILIADASTCHRRVNQNQQDEGEMDPTGPGVFLTAIHHHDFLLHLAVPAAQVSVR